MKRIKTYVLALSFISLMVNAQTHEIVTDKSTMSWLGEKVTGEHYGKISIKSGSFTLKDKVVESGTFVIDMTSITCEDMEDPGRNARFVNHLKSDDFFSVENHKEATFEITKKSDFSKGQATVKGKLTIKGITEEIEFKATLQEKEEGIKIYANIVVDRTKYDIRYGSGSFFDDLGDRTIYDEFKLKINLLAKSL